MRRAILHIGTEKTGTTSIQKFLFENRISLGAAGMLFPATAGYISNQNLVVYGKRAPEPDLAPQSLDVNDPAMLSLWKEQFVREHCSEVLSFQTRHSKLSTLVYSAEHLQSRLTTLDEITRIARLLRPLFDDIKVLVYLRRQDRYALSAHSTSVRGGDSREFQFESIHASGPYYNYRKLLEQWSEVFGAGSIIVRVFEKNRLSGGDAVSDFCQTIGIDTVKQKLLRPEPVNEALSFTALAILRRFNTLADKDPRLLQGSKPEIRPYLLDKAQGVEDAHGRILPSRASAMAFHEQFRIDNQWIADNWLDAQGFDEGFDDYPDTSVEMPVLNDVDEQLDCLLHQIHSERMQKAEYRTAVGS